MSAYEDAVQAAVVAIYGVDTSSARMIATRAIAGFLAALPPSIVVDGKVVPIFDAEDVAQWAWIAASPVPSRTQGESTIARLLDAAREVAE